MDNMPGLSGSLYEMVSALGRMPIDQFMLLANREYYANGDSIGADFITAPEVSQLFGEMIALWIYKQWVCLRRPSKLTLLELGPGLGTMMLDILRTIRRISDFSCSSVSIILCEQSQRLRLIQQSVLRQYMREPYKIKWQEEMMPSIASVGDDALIVVANEFFDALPIKQFAKLEGKNYEIEIASQSGSFVKVQPLALFTQNNTNRRTGKIANAPDSAQYIKHHLLLTQ